VDQKFMSRLIQHHTYVFDRYIIYCPLRYFFFFFFFLNINFEQQFDINSNRTHLLEINCKY
ncbi:uncharacterized protein BX663DRAFT_439840, partial [Cokeromyces recurvatus]|uniref:uncharacterized protein n=1 Tax=Cokeromyces recurvatus TaxID=90255 RepID=UPI00221FFE6F